MSSLSARIPDRERVGSWLNWRRWPVFLVAVLIIFVFAYILFITTVEPFEGGNWRTTTFGSAVHDPSSFLKIVLDSLTFASALFIVASGFALIFGLMRTVNMAHGGLYLLAGYIAYEVQQTMTGQGFSLQSSEVNTWEWLVPLLVAAPCIMVVGLVLQQAFLRWTQGQELRQALITIAVSVIIADQIIAHFPRKVSTGAQRFGGNAVDLTWPGWVDNPVNLHVGGIAYSGARLAVLAIGVTVGVALWLWLYRTKTGMKIRAGVDDEKMTAAIGINIQKTFAITFAVGCMLAALGAVVWASQSNISSGQDGQWLLNSLVVVIVGGMGSIFGAAAGALLFAFVSNFGAAYLPTTSSNCCTQYSTILTFVLIALVLSFRPSGLFGAARMNPSTWTRKQQVERGLAAGALVLVIVWPAAGFSAYWAHSILTQTFVFGIAAASLIFLSAYGGMVSLAQTALFGIAGIILGNLATAGGTGGVSKGLHLGWDPTLSLVLAIVGTTVIGLIGGAVASRSTGIYFLMITLTYSVIATYTLGQVTNIAGFSGIAGINRYTPSWLGDVVVHPNRLYYIALGTAIVAYVMIRYVVRTPFGVSLQGVRDEPIRMASLGYAVPLHRTLAFGFSAFLAALAGVLYGWYAGTVAPGDVDLPQTISLLIMAVIGGLTRIEGAWIGAFAFILMQNYITTSTHIPLLGFGGTLFGGSFNTLIGIIFLAIVVVSPDGLMGMWGRLFRPRQERGGGGEPTPEPAAGPAQ